MRRQLGVALLAGAMLVSSPSARANDADVTMQNTAFKPGDQTIDVGDTVIWTNQDSTAHTASSDDGSFDSSPACIALTGSNCMDPGSTYRHTFNEAGTFTYHCKIHGTAMTGSIIVKRSATTVASSSSETTTSLASDQPFVTQGPLPSLPSSQRALPKSIVRDKNEDDTRPWVFAAIGIAGATTIAGVVLVRRGRVPLG